MGILGYTKY